MLTSTGSKAGNGIARVGIGTYQQLAGIRCGYTPIPANVGNFSCMVDAGTLRRSADQLVGDFLQGATQSAIYVLIRLQSAFAKVIPCLKPAIGSSMKSHGS